MRIRPFQNPDLAPIIALFQTTVHTVCRKDYTPEQLNAWAPKTIDKAKWARRLESTFAIVADDGQSLAGFANLRDDGLIDFFYVAAHRQGQGVGKLLMAALEQEAQKNDLKRLTADVSLTARKFFTRHGFTVQKEYQKVVSQVAFLNAMMEKELI